MLHKITQNLNFLEYTTAHFVQSLSEKQRNEIKKTVAIVYMVFGIALGIYVLYKVLSSCLRKKAPETAAKPQQNSPIIDLQKIKDHKLSSQAINPPEQALPEELSKPLEEILFQTQPNASEQITPETLLQSHVPVHLPQPLPLPDPSIILPGPLLEKEQPEIITPPKTETPAPSLVEPAVRFEIVPEPEELTEIEKQYNFFVEGAKVDLNDSILHLIVRTLDHNPTEAIELIDLALTKRETIDASNNKNQTPLFYASNIAIIDHLIDCGANPNAQDADKETCWHSFPDNLEILQTFVNRGAKLDIPNKHNKTILELAIDNYIDYPLDENRKKIVEFLIEKGATLGTGNYRGEILKRAFEKALEASYELYSDDKKNWLAIAKDLVLLGADLKTSDPTGKLLIKSLRMGILVKTENRESQAFYFKIGDELAPLSPSLAACDPEGRLLKDTFGRLINNATYMGDLWLSDFYLKIADKLAAMGSVRIDIADPKGELLNAIFRDAIKQYPSIKPDYLATLYFKVADKLIELGATLSTSDPDSSLLEDVIMKAANTTGKERNFYLAMVKELLARNSLVGSDFIGRVNHKLSLTAFLDTKMLIQGMIQAGLPLEIEIYDKPLSGWKAEAELGLKNS